MLVFGHGGGLPLILFPTFFGRYHQNKDFGLVDAVANFIQSDLDNFYNKRIHPVAVLFVENLSHPERNSLPAAAGGIPSCDLKSSATRFLDYASLRSE